MDTGINMLGQFSESELSGLESTERQQTESAAMQEGSTSKLPFGVRSVAYDMPIDEKEELDNFIDDFWENHHQAITDEKDTSFKADKFAFVFRDYCDVAF